MVAARRCFAVNTGTDTVHCESSAEGTYLAAPEEKEWYVVYGKSQKEDLAQHHMRLKGFEVFFPKLRLPEHVRSRSRVIPLFPNYLFVRLNFAKEAQYVRWSPGVKHFVCFNSTPVPLDYNIVDFLRERATSEGLIMANSNLRAGQQVVIEQGPFAGLAGIIQEPPDSKGRIKVLMNLLSRDVPVEIPIDSVKTGWQPLAAT